MCDSGVWDNVGIDACTFCPKDLFPEEGGRIALKDHHEEICNRDYTDDGDVANEYPSVNLLCRDAQEKDADRDPNADGNWRV